jgi:hypothetical protein
MATLKERIPARIEKDEKYEKTVAIYKVGEAKRKKYL